MDSQTPEEEVKNIKAVNFLLAKVKTYEPFTHNGLNKLPYILMDAVAETMEEYKNAELSERDATIAGLLTALKTNLQHFETLNQGSGMYGSVIIERWIAVTKAAISRAEQPKNGEPEETQEQFPFHLANFESLIEGDISREDMPIQTIELIRKLLTT